MKDILTKHPAFDWKDVLNEDLPFSIPVTIPAFAKHQNFCWGYAEYGVRLDQFLEYLLVGSSEYAVAAQCCNWIDAITLITVGQLYRNQHNPSSISAKKPVAVIMCSNAMALRVDEKISEDAGDELISKLPCDAVAVLPLGSNSMPGIAITRSHCSLYDISFDPQSSKWEMELVDRWNLSVPAYRYLFIVTMFKLARYFVSIKRPRNIFAPPFPPGIRRRTCNGHFLTWQDGGLLKTHKDGSAAKFKVIEQIYDARIEYIEQGSVVNHRSILVTTVGVPVALHLSTFDRKKILRHIKEVFTLP